MATLNEFAERHARKIKIGNKEAFVRLDGVIIGSYHTVTIGRRKQYSAWLTNPKGKPTVPAGVGVIKTPAQAEKAIHDMYGWLSRRRA